MKSHFNLLIFLNFQCTKYIQKILQCISTMSSSFSQILVDPFLYITLEIQMFNTSNMEYRYLGDTGLKISAIGYGNMINSSPETVDVDDSLIFKCLEYGVNFFDTAEAYSDGQCEKALGRAIKKSKVDRQDVVIATKIYRIGKSVNSYNNTNRKHIIESVDSSLKRLEMDYVDVIFAHAFDQYTSIQQTCQAFNQVIEDGKAFYWATSNWSPQNIYQAFGVCDRLGLHRPVADQCQYNMLVREDVEVGFETLFDNYNYGTTVWSPLAGGFLTGKYLENIPVGSRLDNPKFLTADLMKKFYYEPHNNPKTIGALKQLQYLSKQLGGNLAQLALAWVLKNPNVSTAIIGASRVQQLEDSLGCMGLVKKITPEVQLRINKILGTTPVTKMDWNAHSPFKPRRVTESEQGN